MKRTISVRDTMGFITRRVYVNQILKMRTITVKIIPKGKKEYTVVRTGAHDSTQRAVFTVD